MKPRAAREPFSVLLFDLTEKGSEFRIRWRSRGTILLCIILGGFATLFTIWSAEWSIHKGIVALMNIIKYIPIPIVAFNLARKKAAQYLQDVYELEEEQTASDFLEHVAFNQVYYETVIKDGKVTHKPILDPKITIKDGKVSEKDEGSPLIQIGGPGFAQVNLKSIALMEKVNGEPEVISPRKDAWRIGSFERLREIGDSDEKGKRKYAIIDLLEVRQENISLTSRTKDGIPVEARDIKVRFNILRQPELPSNKHLDVTLRFDERAVYALVYKQTIITPELNVSSGVGFPWNNTIIPLVVSEIERIINSYTAHEIIASLGKKEMESISTTEESVARARVEITGKNAAYTGGGKNKTESHAKSRAEITEYFHRQPFTDKASKLGVELVWIDIGIWEAAVAIRDKINNAWKTERENRESLIKLERGKKQRETQEVLSLIDNVVLSFTDRISEPENPNSKELSRRKLEGLLLAKPEMANDPSFQAQLEHLDSSKKGANAIVSEMLKAFRRELLAGRELIEEKEKLPEEEKLALIDKIQKTLDGINIFLRPRYRLPAPKVSDDSVG
jgi:hypothetical protein